MQDNLPPQGTAIVFDLSDRTQIELLGPDRLKFLHGFCTNDIKSLNPGQGCEVFLTNIKGRVLGHLFVFAGTDSLWLDTVPGQEAAIINHLDRYVIREDVRFVGHASSHGELLLTGTGAFQLLDVPDLSRNSSITRLGFGCSYDIRRIDVLEEPGFLISLPHEAIGAMRDDLLSRGCEEGTRDQFESRRIEAGYPVYGVDITEDNIAQEVGRTNQCISFTKGCYLGQEPIARLDAMGHTNRELKRIRFPLGIRAVSGGKLLASEGDDEAGIITSVSPHPTSSGEIACLAYVKSRSAKELRYAGNPAILGYVLIPGT